SGKYLDVEGAKKDCGTNVWQYDSNGSNAQKWLIKEAGNGYYHIISKCGGLCLDVSGAKTKNGTNIHIWGFNGTNAQKFKFLSVN
ncbi:MAG: RICIN domain-containing protein, partial [Acutalibacteraceae bacterium]